MTGDDGIEIEFHGFIEGLGPFDKAAAAGVIDERGGTGHQVAGVRLRDGGEIHDGDRRWCGRGRSDAHALACRRGNGPFAGEGDARRHILSGAFDCFFCTMLL